MPVSITAVYEQDNIPRDWNIFASDPSGKYQGGGNCAGVAPQQTAYFTTAALGIYNLPKAPTIYVSGRAAAAQAVTTEPSRSAGNLTTLAQ